MTAKARRDQMILARTTLPLNRLVSQQMTMVPRTMRYFARPSNLKTLGYRFVCLLHLFNRTYKDNSVPL